MGFPDGSLVKSQPVMQEAEEIDPKISADSLRVSPTENLIFLRFEMES